MDSSLPTAYDDEPVASRAQPVDQPAKQRSIVLVTYGVRVAGTTRLWAPADFGKAIKPFVSLEHEQIDVRKWRHVHPRPYSGVAILNLVLSGDVAYRDSTGNSGRLGPGGVAWLMSGRGAWQEHAVQSGQAGRIIQLRIALPAAMEDLPPRSRYISPVVVAQKGPARVILGRLGSSVGSIRALDVNLFHVHLQDRQHWQYTPPPRHVISWIAVDRGRLRSPRAESLQTLDDGELAIFEEADNGAIAVKSEGVTSFIIGSSSQHPHPLVYDRHSVHTSESALAKGKAEVVRIGRELLLDARLGATRDKSPRPAPNLPFAASLPY